MSDIKVPFRFLARFSQGTAPGANTDAHGRRQVVFDAVDLTSFATGDVTEVLKNVGGPLTFEVTRIGLAVPVVGDRVRRGVTCRAHGSYLVLTRDSAKEDDRNRALTTLVEADTLILQAMDAEVQLARREWRSVRPLSLDI